MKYTITVSIDQDQDDPQRHIRRLRSWLKHSLRAWNIRAKSIVPEVVSNEAESREQVGSKC